MESRRELIPQAGNSPRCSPPDRRVHNEKRRLNQRRRLFLEAGAWPVPADGVRAPSTCASTGGSPRRRAPLQAALT
jgi:hypothetical protein